MFAQDQFVVYGDTGHHGFDEEVLRLVNLLCGTQLKFSHSWHNTWTDGEPGFRLAEPKKVTGKHVIILACPVTPKLENELRDLITACKRQYGAKSVTAVLPFLRYRRQDRSELDYEITRLRWFLSDLKHFGADNLIVCDPHSIEHTRRYATEFGLNLSIADPTRLFADALKGLVQGLGGTSQVRIYSPDFGSVERAIALATMLGTRVIATPKKRMNGTVSVINRDDFTALIRERFGADAPVSCEFTDAQGMNLIMREDEIDSGSTAVLTAGEIRKAGAKTVHFLATHPVCSRGWKQKFFPHDQKPPFDTVWFGNTRPRGDGETDYEGSTGNRVQHIAIEPVISEILIAVLKSLH
jgi:ribose-phosphate pyrophosphokinase